MRLHILMAYMSLQALPGEDFRSRWNRAMWSTLGGKRCTMGQ